MIKTKVAFLKDRLLPSQSEQSEEFFKKLWLAGKKQALQKSHFCFDHVNRLQIDFGRVFCLQHFIWILNDIIMINVICKI